MWARRGMSSNACSTCWTRCTFHTRRSARVIIRTSCQAASANGSCSRWASLAIRRPHCGRTDDRPRCAAPGAHRRPAPRAGCETRPLSADHQPRSRCRCRLRRSGSSDIRWRDRRGGSSPTGTRRARTPLGRRAGQRTWHGVADDRWGSTRAGVSGARLCLRSTMPQAVRPV